MELELAVAEEGAGQRRRGSGGQRARSHSRGSSEACDEHRRQVWRAAGSFPWTRGNKHTPSWLEFCLKYKDEKFVWWIDVDEKWFYTKHAFSRRKCPDGEKPELVDAPCSTRATFRK